VIKRDTMDRIVQRLDEIEVGDHLLDVNDLPVRCIRVETKKERQTHRQVDMVEVEFANYASHGKVPEKRIRFRCTYNHPLLLTAQCVNPSIFQEQGKDTARLSWYTWCDRDDTRHGLHRQVDQLQDDARRSGDLLTEDEKPSIPPDLTPKASRGSANFAMYLRSHKHAGRAGTTTGSFPLPLAAHPGSTEPARRGLSGPTELDLVGAKGTNVEVDEDEGDGDWQPNIGGDASSGTTSFISSTDLVLTSGQLQRLAKATENLEAEKRHCDCGTFHKARATFDTLADAETARSILASTHCGLLDPNVVYTGDRFQLPARSFNDICRPASKPSSIKVFRSPLAAQPTASDEYTTTSHPLIPAKLLGLWFGDGAERDPKIIASDDETRLYMEQCVKWFNERRPANHRPCKLTATLVKRAGDYQAGIDAHSTKDVYHLSIVSDSHPTGLKQYSPFLDGLRTYGVLGVQGGKAKGIPKEIKQADRDTRLAFLAGLVEADGSFDAHNNSYELAQIGENHQKLLFDAHSLVQSCGMDSKFPRQFVGRPTAGYATFKDGAKTHIGWKFNITRGYEAMLQHINIPTKRPQQLRAFKDHDTRIFTVTDVGASARWTSITVTGGNQFQLADRTMVLGGF